MGFESTSDFGVRKSKSRKRTRRRTVKGKESQRNLKNAQIDDAKEFSVVDATSGNGINEESTRRSIKVKSTENDENSRESLLEENLTKRIKRESNASNETNERRKDSELVDSSEESTKNVKKPSKRQLKREKAEQREAEKREASKLEATQRALNYVSKWKYVRSEWKFEKLRQIWLMDNLLDDNLIPDSIFPIVLEYFEGCKGMAREQLLKKGMDVIRSVEENEEKRNEIVESVAYKRARLLLQALPTDT